MFLISFSFKYKSISTLCFAWRCGISANRLQSVQRSDSSSGFQSNDWNPEKYRTAKRCGTSALDYITAICECKCI